MSGGELNMAEPKPDRKKGLGIGAVLNSVFAAALGVQSSKNRERDFEQGNAGIYIVAGIIFTALFIGTVMTIVQWVLATR